MSRTNQPKTPINKGTKRALEWNEENFEVARNVSFGVVQIREYERIVGDHPLACTGPALGVGWAFRQKDDVPLTTYERKRERSQKLYPLNAEFREFILYHMFDVSPEEIRQAVIAARRVRQQRQETNANLKQKRRLHTKSKLQEDLRAEMVSRQYVGDEPKFAMQSLARESRRSDIGSQLKAFFLSEIQIMPFRKRKQLASRRQTTGKSAKAA